jgi:hypothetical protein
VSAIVLLQQRRQHAERRVGERRRLHNLGAKRAARTRSQAKSHAPPPYTPPASSTYGLIPSLAP